MLYSLFKLKFIVEGSRVPQSYALGDVGPCADAVRRRTRESRMAAGNVRLSLCLCPNFQSWDRYSADSDHRFMIFKHEVMERQTWISGIYIGYFPISGVLIDFEGSFIVVLPLARGL